MYFRIRHLLRYAYGRPVFLEPLILRLTPRQDATQSLLSHELRVVEPPSGCSRILEVHGTDAQVLWFDEPRDHLRIEVESLVRTERSNPFDWIVTETAAQKLPMGYNEALSAALAPSLESADEPVSPLVRAWATELAREVGGSSTNFLIALADGIHLGFHHVGRFDGDPFSPEECLASRSGACRDTAMLYVAACRSQGLAARFVSGYSIHHPPEVTEQELHAWAEVYLPGGGWRAYDPSLGLAVADGHVALAAAPDHRLAAPTTGSYRGTGVSSQLDYQVRLAAAESESELALLDNDLLFS